jgi:cellulose biosynthesis protein BcsQ
MSDDQKFKVYLAAPDMPGTVIGQMMPAFSDTVRWQIMSLGATWAQMLADVPNYHPDVIILETSLAPNESALRQWLAQLAGTIVILVLPNVPDWTRHEGVLKNIQSVRGVFVAPPNWLVIAQQAYSSALTARTVALNASPVLHSKSSSANGLNGNGTVVGTRIVALMSLRGGTGRSTIAESFAIENARQGIKTLLFSLNTPPSVLGHLPNIKDHPNAIEWLKHPTVDGFTASVQKIAGLDTLDIIVAPQIAELASLHPSLKERRPEMNNSIRALIEMAYSFHYGVIVIDPPSSLDSELTAQSILAANIILIVERCSMDGVFSAAALYDMLTAMYKDNLRVPRDSIYLVHNFVSAANNYSPSAFLEAGARLTETKSFPLILTSLPNTPAVVLAQNKNMMLHLAQDCESFAGAINGMAVKLVGGKLRVEGGDDKNSEKKVVLNFGWFKVPLTGG